MVKRQVSCGTFLSAASRDLSQLFVCGYLSEDKDGLPGSGVMIGWFHKTGVLVLGTTT